MKSGSGAGGTSDRRTSSGSVLACLGQESFALICEVMLQAQQEAMRNTLRAPSVQPFLGFCSHLAKA